MTSEAALRSVKTMRDTLQTRLADAPAVVFARVVDIRRLPEWNRAITEVVEQPPKFVPGSVWKVRLHALGQTWVSASTLVQLDEASGRFRYRSQTDDGNPSYAEWEWHVEPDAGGSCVTVTVDLNPITFWRKHLLAKIRRPALRREIRGSLQALGHVRRA
jgi:polyketide cyclase/dehydrase/lipid transport protein